MNGIYKISACCNDGLRGYDSYDSFVVSAESESAARSFHPNGYCRVISGQWIDVDSGAIKISGDWIKSSEIDSLKVQYLGATDLHAGVILASFNAG